MEDAPHIPNQTNFSYEKPLFEKPSEFQPEVDESAPKKPWFRTRKGIVILVVGVLVVLFLLIAVLAIFAPEDMTPGQETPLVTPSPQVVLSPTQQRIKDLQEELEAADPAKQEFPFPPVDMEMKLPDPNQRNN